MDKEVEFESNERARSGLGPSRRLPHSTRAWRLIKRGEQLTLRGEQQGPLDGAQPRAQPRPPPRRAVGRAVAGRAAAVADGRSVRSGGTQPRKLCAEPQPPHGQHRTWLGFGFGYGLGYGLAFGLGYGQGLGLVLE